MSLYLVNVGKSEWAPSLGGNGSHENLLAHQKRPGLGLVAALANGRETRCPEEGGSRGRRPVGRESGPRTPPWNVGERPGHTMSSMLQLGSGAAKNTIPNTICCGLGPLFLVDHGGFYGFEGRVGQSRELGSSYWALPCEEGFSSRDSVAEAVGERAGAGWRPKKSTHSGWLTWTQGAKRSRLEVRRT